jgi:N-acetylglucosaminyldiphosphoundecaprenol N-acetyl-beta-D-mannosaminyltransferase
MQQLNNREKVNILGVGINPITLDQALNIIIGWIERHEENYVCITPAHGIMECQRDNELLKIFNGSGLTTPDGMSIVWILKIRGYQNVSRVYGPDLMEAICRYSSDNRRFRHFFYGGADGVPDKLSEKLQNRFPYLDVVGTISPPFRPLSLEEDEIIINQINSANPDIVWVGISTPKQERWMATHIGRLNAPVIIGVGAAFDFLSGIKKQAPKTIQRSGLEWLFRLASEPKRLWRRYVEYPKFVILVLIQLLGLKHYPMKNTCIRENHEYNDN